MSNNESGGLQDLAAALQDEGSNRPTQAEVAASVQLQRYRSHKVVNAAKIAGVSQYRNTGEGGLTFVDGQQLMVSPTYMAKHAPQPGGYFVVYEDGYESWSPAEAFEAGYTALAFEWDDAKECRDVACTIAVKHMHVPGGFTTPTPLEEGQVAPRTKYEISEAEEKRLADVFTYHAPKGDQTRRYEEIRLEALELARSFAHYCPPGRALALAQTHLEQAVMFANAAIARGE
jgi:hypothetical protein